jgi:hypothetical protein
VLEALKKAEGMKRNNLGELFTDVYGGEEPWNLVCPSSFPTVVEADAHSLLAVDRATGRTCGIIEEVR